MRSLLYYDNNPIIQFIVSVGNIIYYNVVVGGGGPPKRLSARVLIHACIISASSLLLQFVVARIVPQYYNTTIISVFTASKYSTAKFLIQIRLLFWKQFLQQIQSKIQILEFLSVVANLKHRSKNSSYKRYHEIMVLSTVFCYQSL